VGTAYGGTICIDSLSVLAIKRVVMSVGMATKVTINGETPKPGTRPRDRAKSSAPTLTKYYLAIILAFVALCVGMYFGLRHSKSCVRIASSDQSVSKPPVSILLEHCQQNKLKNPEYIEVPVQNGSGFSYIVTVKGNSYNGMVRANKQEAKHSAAEVALQQLGLSKSVTFSLK